MANETPSAHDQEVQAEDQASVNQCQEELVNAKEERDEWKSKCMLLAADFENYKKRNAKDRQQWQQLITARVLTDVLTVVDDVQRALKAEQDSGEGLRVVHKQLEALLQSYNVREITQLGVFDPSIHEAVAHVQSGDHESGTIIEVLQKGYFLGDSGLRPAKVAVAQ